VDTRKIAALILAALAAFGAVRNGSLDGVSAIAAGVHKSRAERQAVVYRDAAAKVRAGEFADASALGRFLTSGVAAIETDVAQPLSKSAAAALPKDKIEKPEDVAAWLEAAAKGFDSIR
jgi:hypothetical protein